jgi:L-2-hydroxyglutarate oxidase
MEYDILVIGGGIVGFASALELLQQNPDLKVGVLEKEVRVAAHQTGNNSGVIHSGIYYKPGSLKAKNCIDGYHLLLDFCNSEKIPYELCGKIIVAIKEAELPLLDTLYERGVQNGLEGIRYITGDEIREFEPHCAGIRGIHVPQTGIVNYRLVTEKLAEKFYALGGDVLFNQEVLDVKVKKGFVDIQTNQKKFSTRVMLNCGGLYCDKIARMAGQNLDVKIIPFRGEYYSIKPVRAHLVRNLIYPVPDPNFPFLGVHFTRRISGEIEAGPNAVFAFRREGYKRRDFKWSEFWESLGWKGFRKVAWKYWKTGLGEYYRSYSKKAFTKALQQLVPELRMDDLEPGGAGVRAQACDRNGGLIDDFYIREDEGCVHVLNAPSPAATSALSIGRHVAGLALAKLAARA